MCSLVEILQVFHAGLVNIDLWWVIVLKGLIIQLSLMPISSQYRDRQVIQESESQWGDTLQASGHSAVRRQMQRLVKNPLKTSKMTARMAPIKYRS